MQGILLDPVTGRPAEERAFVRRPVYDEFGQPIYDERKNELRRRALAGKPIVSGGAQGAVGYCVSSGTSAQALTAATAATVVNLIAGSAVGLHVVEFGISFDGVSATAVPVLVELFQSTQATAGTSTSGTVNQLRGRVQSSGITAGVVYTAEPTVLTPVKQWLVTPNGGLFVMQFPLGREPESDLSGGTIKAIGLRATAPAAVNTRAYMEFET